MMKQFKKVLSILCASALLVTSLTLALAEEPAEQPVGQEPVVEEPVVEEPVVEEPAVEEPVVEEPVVEEPVAEEPVVEEPVVEEPVVEEPVVEEPVVEEPVVEEPVVEEPVVEEPVVEEPVVEEPVVEEPVAEEPVVEEPVVEEPVVEEPVVAEPVIEEPVVAEPVVEEPASEEKEEVPAEGEEDGEEAPAEEEASDNTDAEDEEEDDGLVPLEDNEGYVDQEVIEENTPAITDELKGLRDADLYVGQVLTDYLRFGDELTVTLKGCDASTIELQLYIPVGASINTKVDGKAVSFTPADCDDPSLNLYTYELTNAAGRTHEIVLNAYDDVPFQLAAVVMQVEEIVEETPVQEEETPAAEENDEAPVAEDNNEPSVEEINETPAEGSVNDTPADDQNGQPEETPAPTIQVSVKTYDALKVGRSISDSLVAGQKARIQVKCGKTPYVTLTLSANPDDVIVTIDGEATEFTTAGNGIYTCDLDEVAFRKFAVVVLAKQDLDFTLSASARQVEGAEIDEAEEDEDTEEESEDIINKEEIAEEVTEEFAEETEEVAEEAVEETEEEDSAEESTEESEEEVSEEVAEEPTEETEEESETSEEGEETEGEEDNTEEETEEAAPAYVKVIVTAEEGADLYAEADIEAEVIGHLEAGEEALVILNEEGNWAQIYSEDEEAAAQFISMEDAEIVATEEAEEETEDDAPAYIKIVVTNEEGAELYAEADKEAEVVGHLDVGEEALVILDEEGTWAQIYSEDEEAAPQFIFMEDAEVVAEEEIEEETEEEAEPLTEEQMIELGYRKVQILNKNGANIYAAAEEEAEVIGHADFESELWIIDLEEAEGWAEVYTEKEPGIEEDPEVEEYSAIEEETKQFIKLAEIEKQLLTDEEIETLGYRKVQVLNGDGVDLYDSTEEEANAIEHVDFESELWIKDVEAEDWAEVYNEEEIQKFVRTEDIDKLTDEQMLAMGYVKVYVAYEIGANVYATPTAAKEDEEPDVPVDHLDANVELWVKLIEDADRAQIYDKDEEAPARYISLVDIIAILKPEGMDELPVRSIKATTSLEGVELVYYGTPVHLEATLENFLSDDVYTIQWKYSQDNGETYYDIEDANELQYDYIVDAENLEYCWKIVITLLPRE